MSYTSKEVLEILGEAAQVTAGGIVVHQKVQHPDGEGEVSKHILVGTFPGHSFELTPEGLDVIAKVLKSTDDEPKQPAKPAGKGKRVVAPVEPEVPDFGD